MSMGTLKQKFETFRSEEYLLAYYAQYWYKAHVNEAKIILT